MVVVVIATASCGDSSGLLCGVAFEGSDGFRSCSRNKEVCVCATNSCAVRVDDPSGCSSGYQYVDDGFAEPQYRGRCVDDRVTNELIVQGASVQSCEAIRDAGTGSGSASGSGSGSGS